MKTPPTTAFLFALGVLLTACTGDGVVQSDCQRTGTALVMFENHTPDATFHASVDNAIVATLSPGETASRDVHAGRHTLRCCIPLSADACTSRTDTLDVCSQTTYDCVLPPCITDQTARITLVNDSSCCPFAVYVDGFHVADLGPGESTDVIVSTGAVHPAEFRVGTETYCSMNFAVTACGMYSLHCTRT